MNTFTLDPDTQAFLDTIGGQAEILDNSEAAIAEARRNMTASPIDDSKWPPVDTESDREIEPTVIAMNDVATRLHFVFERGQSSAMTPVVFLCKSEIPVAARAATGFHF